MLKKPPQCHGCPLCSVSTGYAPPVGPDSSDLLFLGESLGKEEAIRGELFTGGAGATLNRGFHFTKLNRPLIKLASLVSCSPPGFDLKSRETSVDHCRRAYLNPTIERWLQSGDPSRKVLVALGGHALRNVLGLRDAPNIKVQDFHGTVTRDPSDRFWVVPTFSPKFIQQGAFNFLGTFYWDIEVAKDVAENGNPPDPAELVMDPPVEWFSAWVDNHIASMKHEGALDPDSGTLLAADIETPEKTRKGDEGELTHKDRDYNIIRINFSNHTDEGITVPWHGPYLAHIKRLLESPGVKLFHNKNYDVPRLLHAGVKVRGPIFDTMEMWHKLQSDVPRGLGFVAPFYSRYGAWKHLSSVDPVKYAAIDPLQTIRIGYEARDELIKKDLWETPFIRHTYLLDTHALNPASEVGFDVDKEALFAADGRLDEIIFETDEKIQRIVPDSLRPLFPKEGLTSPPKAEKADKYGRVVKVIEQSGEHLVRWCSGCNEVVKTAKHKKKEDGTPCPAPATELKSVLVKRWFRVMPFNVGSRDHLFAYMASKKHQPGRDKKTKKPTANKDTLKKLAAKTKDPLYILALRRKQCDKISSTYIKGTVKRLATNPRSMADGRLHPTTTHKPSTQRTSQQDPNLQNVVARGADEELASLFRRCLIARADSILVEADFSGIEAVETGYFAGDPSYIRLAKLGVHAYLASHLLSRDRKIGSPADLAWEDISLLAFFKDLKERFPAYYDLAKRCVHGCLPPDHEVLTVTGWKRFDQLRDGESVAQWHRDGSRISFVPAKLHVYDTDQETMVKLDGRGLQINMTSNHRVPICTSEANPVRVRTAGELVDYPAGQIPVTGVLEYATTGLDWTSNRALFVAMQADAQVTDHRAVFHLVKPRKIFRLKLLLDRSQLTYTETPCTCHPGRGVHIRFSFDRIVGFCLFDPRDKTKSFILSTLMMLSYEARLSFLEELLLWDGTKRVVHGKQFAYFTTNKDNAIIVQTIAHLSNRQALIREAKRAANQKPMWIVSFNRRKYARVKNLNITTSTTSEKVYCVTVPSSFFLVRYKDTISVTGNSNYAMTPKGMAMQFPELFPNERAAALAQGIYFEIAPSFPRWQLSIKERANRQGYLGGKDHPFRYIHYFFNVASLRPARGIVRQGGIVKRGGTSYITTWGEDAKRACAFYPQSTAAGVIKESMLRLFVPGTPNYIGDRWFGKTPLRALVHDSLVLELDRRTWEADLHKVITEMVRPIAQQPLDPAWGMGTHLSIGVEVKCGQNWAPWHKEQNPTGMQKYKLPADLIKHASELAADIVVPLDYYDDELDLEEMMGELEEAGA